MNPETESFPTAADAGSSFQTVARLVATAIGLALMVIGIIYTIRLMDGLYGVINDPNSMKAMIDQWILAVGKDTIVIKHKEIDVEGTKVLVIALLSGIALVLTWLSLGIILAGARVVSMTTSDKEAIKKVLAEALGRSGRR